MYEFCNERLQALLRENRSKQELLRDAKVDGASTSVPMATNSEQQPNPFESGLPADFIGIYELEAVVTHKGRSADSGHYIGWVRQEPGSSFWYKTTIFRNLHLIHL